VRQGPARIKNLLEDTLRWRHTHAGSDLVGKSELPANISDERAHRVVAAAEATAIKFGG
jgi:hypothetical protein